MPGLVLVFSCHARNPNLDMQLSASCQKQEQSSLCTLWEQSFSDGCLAAPAEGAQSLTERTDVSVKLKHKALWRKERERSKLSLGYGLYGNHC